MDRKKTQREESTGKAARRDPDYRASGALPNPASSKPQIPFPSWLRRFMLGFTAFYAFVCLAIGVYSLYGQYMVVEPAREALEDGSSDSMTSALDRLSTPHVFSGYAPWHGFGSERSEKLAVSVNEIVARGEEYTEDQLSVLVRWASFWITAAEEHKVNGDVPWVEGDAVVLRSLLDRWDNALSTSKIFMIYLALVALIFGSLFLVYRRKNLFEKIGLIN